jgi:hypothetical protein
MRYHDRPKATEHLRGRGVRIGDTTLEYLASRGRGPRYAIVNGRAVYLAEDLDAWVDQQAARPPRRRREQAA